MLTRKLVGKNLLGMVCQWLDWLDDKYIRRIWPETTLIWHRNTKFHTFTCKMYVAAMINRHLHGQMTVLQKYTYPRWITLNNTNFTRQRPILKYSRIKFTPGDVIVFEKNEIREIHYNDGRKEWRQDHLIHRDGDLPAVVHEEYKMWYQDNKVHRVGGPAYIGQDVIAYYNHGRCHRVDGPAIIYMDGTEKYYIHGVRVA